MDCKEIQLVHLKGNPPWIFSRRTDAETEAPVLWSPDVKSWLIWKDPDAGKDWGQEEKGMTEDEMVGWHHQLYGHGFGWTLELVMDREAWHASVHGVTKSRTWTEWLNWTEPKLHRFLYKLSYHIIILSDSSNYNDLFAVTETTRALVARIWKHLPVVQETLVWSLGREASLEKEMVIHSSILAGESHEWRSLVGYSLWGHKNLDATEWLTHTMLTTK